MTTEQAKCLALYRFIDHFGEEALLRHLRNITVSTTCNDNIVEVHFTNNAEGDEQLSLYVLVDCVSGETITRDQP